MISKTRVAGSFAALSALLLLAGCGSGKNGEGATPKVKPPTIACDIQLKADENQSSFNKSSVVCAKTGTAMITVTNPPTSKGKHGVGIDGGVYKNIKGQPVKPGRATSLTVAVKGGTKYVIFDSYGSNRSKGYETTMTVKK